MTEHLTPTQYRELLHSALPTANDADTSDPSLRTLFTPQSHKIALEPDVTVVRGARGVGKTVWFKALLSEELRRVAADAYRLPSLSKVETYAGYSTELRPANYPGPAVLVQLMAERCDPAHIWLAASLCTLGVEQVTALPDWSARVRWVRENPEPADLALHRADRTAGETRLTRLLLFDALDRMHADRGQADTLVGGLLRLALDLRTRTRHIRAKVFIRPDMLESGGLHFPDASKLLSNSADLRWTESGLYGLLFHGLGNAESDLAVAFRESSSRGWKPVGGASGPRWTAPNELVGDKDTQRAVFQRIAGQYMGAGHRKGHTYTWLPNHLMDGRGEVSPRSFLLALRKAVEVTVADFSGHGYAVHYEGIRKGVQEASRTRVAEIGEDMPWVRVAFSPLEGLQVPTDEDIVVDKWKTYSLASKILDAAKAIDPDRHPEHVVTGPRDPHNYAGLIDQLVKIGVVTRRANGRLDVPDVYRIAFNMGRSGGVPRVGSATH